MAMMIDSGGTAPRSSWVQERENQRFANRREASRAQGTGMGTLERYLREREREAARARSANAPNRGPAAEAQRLREERAAREQRLLDLERERDRLRTARVTEFARSKSPAEHMLQAGADKFLQWRVRNVEKQMDAVRQSLGDQDNRRTQRMDNRIRTAAALSRDPETGRTIRQIEQDDWERDQAYDPTITAEDRLARLVELKNTMKQWNERTPENEGYAQYLPSWITEEHVQQLMETGTVYGINSMGIGAPYSNVSAGAQAGDVYLGVAENWADNFAAIRFDSEADRYAIREAIYKVGDAVPELRKMTQAELDQFRDYGLTVNQYSYLRGGAIVDGPFGVGKELTEADVQMMQYLMGWANENGTTWDDAGGILTQAAIRDEEAGLYGTDGGGGGGRASELSPVLKTVDTYFTLSDMDYARQTLTAVMEDRLGRRATDAEIKQYLGSLNALERSKPRTVTTTYDYNEDDQQVGSSVLTEQPEIDRGGIALDATEGQEQTDFQEARAMETILQLAGW